MATRATAVRVDPSPDPGKHPRGLYVLFGAEMWERFSFYSMLALFTLYLQDPNDGFGWTAERATTLYSWYLAFVYASPLVGGFIADRKLGYRRSVMIGGFFFMAGHLLLAFPTVTAVYAALTCLVIGNGFFKPNVSTMVGNLYPDGSRLKDRAYNLFYMGINIGAFLAPVVATVVQAQFGFHPAFAVAAVGMVISVTILWRFKHHLESDNKGAGSRASAQALHTAVDAVAEWKRLAALVVVFVVVVVFWMVFHQNGTTITYWADENTDWKVRGIISNAINPAWVIILTPPLIGFWKWLDARGIEPATPIKMVIGMAMTSLAFLVLFFAAKSGEATVAGADIYAFKMSPAWLLGAYGVLTLGELMLSPMGLSLVSKVAPRRFRGVMMGGWFVATGLGNKLTQIAVFWTEWKHSTFWLVLSAAAAVMAVVLLALSKPLR